MLRLALALSVCGAVGCHEPEPQTGGHCVATEPVLQVGIEKTHLCVGEVARPHASYSDGCESREVTAEVEWTSTAPKIATVEQTGKITASKVGVANIVAIQGPRTSGVRIFVADCP
ncbi:MAG: Ig-like domain-containing protein [Polyangiales bacterium]